MIMLPERYNNLTFFYLYLIEDAVHLTENALHLVEDVIKLMLLYA